jgi:flagellar biosynthesis regulator FlaF
MKRKPLFLFFLTFVFTKKNVVSTVVAEKQRERGRETFDRSISLEKEEEEEEEEEASTCFFERGRAWHSWRRSA